MNDEYSCYRVAVAAGGLGVVRPIIAAPTAEIAETRAVELLGGHALGTALLHTEAEGHPQGQPQRQRARAAARKDPVPA